MRAKLFREYVSKLERGQQSPTVDTLYGTSLNAVKTQIWIAVCVYVLVMIIAKGQHVNRNPTEILQVLGIMLFEKVPMEQALTAEYKNDPQDDSRNQLLLFNF